jgi:hypothetical protein
VDEWQPVINLGASTVLGIVGWFVKTTRDDARQAQRDLNSFQLDVARNYVTHTQLGDIRELLVRIEEKLDRKKDKD